MLSKKPKESTKENKENTHRFLRLHGVSHRSAVFLFRLRRISLASQTPYGQTVLGFSGYFYNSESFKTFSKANTEGLQVIYPSCTRIKKTKGNLDLHEEQNFYTRILEKEVTIKNKKSKHKRKRRNYYETN